MPIIDAHLHFMGDHADSLRLLDELDLQLLNITVAHQPGAWRQREADHYRELARRWPRRYAWCTSFDPPPSAQPDPAYTARVIEGLERDFADGAVACKVWKNIGMEITDADGRYVMVDDPVFERIFAYLEETDRTLLMHIAEPRACWEPLDRPSPHQAYYRQHPQWHMHGREDVPSHEQLMAARDRVIERHPKLRVVGAHLASLEYDLNEIAKRFERYPNFAIDTSARLPDLMAHGREAVRAFFLTYADRILFGTDIVSRVRDSALSDDDRRAHHDRLRTNYLTQRACFASDGPVQLAGSSHAGLALPNPVLRAFFTDNARRWYPGLTRFSEYP